MMEWLYLLAFVLTWISFNKMRKLHKVESERRLRERERKAASIKKYFEAQRRQRALLRLRNRRRQR